MLQNSVDSNIQQVGFLPGRNSNGAGTGNGNGNGNGHHGPQDDKWACSDKQRDLILKVITENKLDKINVEHLAQERFGKGVRQLNKLQAAGLIAELLEQTGQSQPRNQRFQKAGGAR